MSRGRPLSQILFSSLDLFRLPGSLIENLLRFPARRDIVFNKTVNHPRDLFRVLKAFISGYDADQPVFQFADGLREGLLPVREGAALLIADDLPGICHSWFRLDTRRENTFIAGESMGGYGAVKIGLRRPSRFGAIASLSGVLDYPALIRQVVRGEWTDMEPGEFHFLHGTTKVAGTEDDVIALVRQAASDPNRPRLLQLCGTEDFLYENNQRFRSAAEEAGYGHVYMEAPGEHAWPYWDRAIQQAIRFFLGLSLLDMIYY